ncbi:hypothetical protein FRC02_001685, partial [Tulasnella sp. 418]
MSDPVLLAQQLNRLEQLLRSLPKSLPESLSTSNLPVQMDYDLASEEGYYAALNSALHASFGHRAEGIVIYERGNNILSVIPALEATIDAINRQVSPYDNGAGIMVQSWITSLADAAIDAGAVADSEVTNDLQHTEHPIINSVIPQPSDPVIPQKRSFGVDLTLTDDGSDSDILEIIDSPQLIHKSVAGSSSKRPRKSNAGRKRNELVDELVLNGQDASDPKRVHCVGHCGKSFATRDCQRILSHASTCERVHFDLRYRASSQLAMHAPTEIYNRLEAKQASQSLSSTPTTSISPFDSISQGGNDSGVGSLETKGSGRRAGSSSNIIMNKFLNDAKDKGGTLKTAGIAKTLVPFMVCQGLPASFLSNPYSQLFFKTLAPHWKVPSSTQWEASILPAEASRVYIEITKRLLESENHTLSFDGWTSRRSESIYTLTITEANRRSHFWKFHSDSSASHTGPYLANILSNAITEIGAHRFVAITSDNTGNTRLARKLVTATHPTILNLPDPCHHLHNTIKNIVSLPAFNEHKYSHDTFEFRRRSHYSSLGLE